MKKYKMIQLEESHYLKLKQYCELHQKKMGPVVGNWIETMINPSRSSYLPTDNTKILKRVAKA